MAKTELNNIVSKYFLKIAKLDVKDITPDIVKKHLGPYIKSTNQYGNLAHAIINYDYNKKKILKTLEILFEMGLISDYQGKATGYTFIHLALYGFTNSDKEDESYPTEFIVALIELAKKHNFNVNLKDNDGDSIVHTAIASEVYTGEILPILKALLPEFKIDTTDKQGRDIQKAMTHYLYNATITSWKNRLNREKNALSIFINGLSKNDFAPKKQEELAVKKQKLDKQLEDLINSLTIDDLKLDEIDKLKKEYAKLNKSLELENKKLDLESIYKQLHTALSNLLEKILKTIVTNPSLKKIDNFLNTIRRCPFYTPSIDINKFKDNYQAKLERIKNKVNKATSINAINAATKLISQLTEEELKTKLNSELEEKRTLIDTSIATLKSLQTKNNYLIKFLKLEEKPITINEELITLSEIESLINIEQTKHTNLLTKVNELLVTKVTEAIQPFTELVQFGLLSQDTLDAIILSLPPTPNPDKRTKEPKKTRKQNETKKQS